MNPSASGWIKKFGHDIQNVNYVYASFETLNAALLQSGFVYGIHLHIPDFIKTEHRLTEDEIAKVNLLNALYHTFALETKKKDFQAFVPVVFEYYLKLDVGKINFLHKILNGKKTEAQLEKLLDSRIYLNGSIFSKALGNSLTNSLLFIDVLLFRAYLRNIRSLVAHAKLLEYAAINMAYKALNAKETNKNDTKVIQLLAASLSFIDLSEERTTQTRAFSLLSGFTSTEREFLLHLACLSVWEDGMVGSSELDYMHKIGADLGFTPEKVEKALNQVELFLNKNKDSIPYLQNHNLARRYYEGMFKSVGKLLIRNRKRLKKELAESKELVQLISKSAIKDLSPEEQKKVQMQLLDTFKTIPSLALFMLPGGTVLLPLAISLMPKLLPSAFDDNRIVEKTTD